MNSEESRLRTFSKWPENAVVDSKRVARAGFYYMGQGLEVQCFSCGSRISEWNYGDKVMARHKAMDPRCPFVQNPTKSGNIPLVSGQRRDQLESASSYSPSEAEIELFYDEQARLDSYFGWPLPSILSTELAQSGFYYLQEGTKTRCAYCNNTYDKWRPGDDPGLIHRINFPSCSFVLEHLNPPPIGDLATELNLQKHNSSDFRGRVDFKDLGVQNHVLPRTPKYSTYESRVQSFNNWQLLNQKADDLAEAGFFYTGVNDQVRCFHCDGGLREWQAGDIPWIEHARWFGNCGFMQLIKGPDFVKETVKSFPPNIQNVVTPPVPPLPPVKKTNVTEEQLMALMRSPEAIAALQVGIEASRVKSALRSKFEKTGVSFKQADDLISAALDLQAEENIDEESWATPPDSPYNYLVNRFRERTVNTIPEESEDEPVEKKLELEPPKEDTENDLNLSLEEENRRLKEARLCKICLDVEVCIVFLPCGHLVTCANCAHSLTNCPLCRQHIKATVRTFLS